MNREQQMIWNYLVINALGKANTKNIEVIANEIGVFHLMEQTMIM